MFMLSIHTGARRRDMFHMSSSDTGIYENFLSSDAFFVSIIFPSYTEVLSSIMLWHPLGSVSRYSLKNTSETPRFSHEAINLATGCFKNSDMS